MNLLTPRPHCAPHAAARVRGDRDRGQARFDQRGQAAAHERRPAHRRIPHRRQAFRARTPASRRARGWAQPRIEPEIAFITAEALSTRPQSRDRRRRTPRARSWPRSAGARRRRFPTRIPSNCQSPLFLRPTRKDVRTVVRAPVTLLTSFAPSSLIRTTVIQESALPRIRHWPPDASQRRSTWTRPPGGSDSG
jgi:hypothetical protein